jgi:hypothetical protein
MPTLYLIHNHRQLIKDLIPILNSFLVNKNQAVSLKATDLLNLMEKKILSELFECEGDTLIFNCILNSAPKVLDGIDQDIVRHLTKGEIILPLKTIPDKKVPLTDYSDNVPIFKERKNYSKEPRAKKVLPNVYLKVNTNIINNSNTSNDNLSLRQNLIPFDSNQINLLFKGYLFKEELQDCSEKLQKGLYCNDFYQNTYNKFNNLNQRLAWKRKKVCKKLLHILKALVC